MNDAPTPEPNDVADMYGSTSAEEAASQSNPNQTTKVVSDLVKNNIPRINFVEGDNWVRFINPYKNPWYIAVGSTALIRTLSGNPIQGTTMDHASTQRCR